MFKLVFCFWLLIYMLCGMNTLVFAWDSGSHGGGFDKNNPWPSQSATDRLSSHPGITDPHKVASYTLSDGSIDSPIVFSNDGNNYYFYKRLENNHYLYCVNTSGVFQWSAECGNICGGAPIVADDGIVYVLEYDHVRGFNSEGTLVFLSTEDTFGESHEYKGAGDNYLTVDNSGNLLFTQVSKQATGSGYGYVDKYRFIRMSKEYIKGYIVQEYSSLPLSEYGDLESESSVAIDDDGYIYVFIHGKLCIFDSAFNQVHLSSNDAFYLPSVYDITIGPDNTIFVATYAELEDSSFVQPYGSLVKIKFNEARTEILETIVITDNGDPYSNTPYINCKVAVDNEGNAYAVTGLIIYHGTYVEEKTGRLLKIDTDNNVTTLYTAPEGKSLFHSPTITKDGIIYLSNGVVLNTDGEVLWSKPSAYSQAIDNNGYVYFVTANSITSYKQRDPGYPYLPAASASVSEVDPIDGDYSFNVEIRRNGGSEGSFTVNYKTVNDTAVAGIDYVETSGTVTFGDKETSKYISVPCISDRIYTGDRQFSFIIENPSGSEELPDGTSTSVTLIILEDDAIDNIDPYVVNSNPAGGETNYRNDGNMLVEFDDYIIEGSNFSDITLTDGTNYIPLNCTLGDKSITIKFSQVLLDSTTYTLSIGEDAINDESGNNMAGGWSVSFSTPSLAFAGGNGSVQSPYLINSPSSLDGVRNYPDKCFRLISDIDMGPATSVGGDYYYDGKGFIPIDFRGIFDGNGYTISNMNIDRTDDQTYVGIFGMNHGTITDITLENCNIRYSNTKDKSVAVGVIAGRNDGIIFNCVNKSTVTFSQSGRFSSYLQYYCLGGIAGKNTGIIEKCANLGDVNSNGIYSSSQSCIGGITGQNKCGTIRTSYNDVSISTPSLERNNYVEIGGIAGISDGSIEDCYNTGEIGSDYGILGVDRAEWDAPSNTVRCYTINNEYSIGSISGKFAHAYNIYQFGGVDIFKYFYDMYGDPVISDCVLYDKTDDTKKTASSFRSFDFNDVWDIEEGNYPTLKSQIIAPTDITVEQTELNLKMNQTFTLNPIVLPSDATFKLIKYVSSDPSIVSVDNNATVEGKAVGTATITIFTLDGMKYTDVTVNVTGFEVRFDVNNGSNVPNINVGYDTKISKPDNPIKTGYTFENWYKDSELKILWNFDADTVTENTTLYAKWTPNTYNIIFDVNNGSNVPNINANYDTKISKPDNPIKIGYTFENWYKDSELKILWNFNEDTIKEDTTLYAKWTPNTYNIIFDVNNGSDVPNINADYDTKISKPDNPIKTGYTFENWYKDSEFNTKWDFDVDTVTENTTLYAKWTPNTYNIIFDANLGTGSETSSNVPMHNQTFTYGISANLSNNTLTKIGYNFKGWNTISDGSGINYLDGESIVNLSAINNATMTLYAQWEKKKSVSTSKKTITTENTTDENGRPVTIINIRSGDDLHFITTKINVNEEERHRYIVKAIFKDGSEKIMKDAIIVDDEISFISEKGIKYRIEYVEKSFEDTKSHWAKKAIEALAVRGVIMGTSETKFAPNETISKADFVTLISRYFNLTSENTKSFVDVADDKYYSMPISTLKALGVLPPVDEDLFNPNEPITRQDIMYIFYMVMIQKNVDIEGKNLSVDEFNDLDKISDYAMEATKYLVSRDIIHGYNNTLNPTGTATRAEIAQILFSMIELLRM
ncbi:InlB B-repeat-containing protein [Anaerovorax sp. IOR16]|uniref:InlB B-repeat-containing protein n=1 Tax=Anaerovorax sp. IOR16 TaxID=2773458 RepID=UPI0019D19F17|nr:InlB B-repeat-containing protein [Anaerovorax sp. IOR16]